MKQVEESGPQEEYALFTVPSGTRAPLYATVTVDHKPLTMEVDTGALFSVISKATYDQMFSSHPLQKSELKTYTGEPLSMYGQFTTEVHN